jgi:hypothetical protein
MVSVLVKCSRSSTKEGDCSLNIGFVCEYDVSVTKGNIKLNRISLDRVQ